MKKHNKNTESTFNKLRSGIILALLACCMAASNAYAGLVAPLTFTQAFSPATIGPGSVSTLTFTITANPTATRNLAFTSTLPTNVVLATPASGATDCTGAILTAANGGSSIAISGGEIGTSASCTVTANVTSSTAATHTNAAVTLTSDAGNVTSATAALVVDATLPGFSKAFNPATIAPGQNSTLTFTYNNTANAAAESGLSFSDTLPTGLVVATPSNTATTCTGGAVTATVGSGSISYYTASQVLAGASCTASVDVTAASAGVYDNVSDEALTASYSTSIGFATAALTVQADSIVKSFTDDPVSPGGTVTLEYTITNRDRSNTATNFAFTDNLNAALANLSATTLPTDGFCGAGSTLTGTTSLTMAGGSLAAEASCTFSVTLDVPAGSADGSYTSTAGALSFTRNGSTVNANQAADILVVASAPTITKTFTDDPVGAGGTVTLSFTITNTSTASAATNIAFKDELTTFLPYPVTVALPANDFCGVNSTMTLIIPSTDVHSLSMANGSLAIAGQAGDSCTFSATITIPKGQAAGTYTNTTEAITATVAAATLTGKTATDNLVVVAGPSMIKEFTDDPALPGGTVTMDFTISHDTATAPDATAIGFTDDLTFLAGLTFNSLVSDDCGGTLSGTTTLTYSGGSLAAATASCTISVKLDVPNAAVSTATHTNTTSVLTSTVSGTTVTNNAASDVLKIKGLNFTKQFLNDPVAPGDNVTLRFTITNASQAEDATAIAFTDDLRDVLPATPDLTVAAGGLPADGFCGAGSAIIDAGGGVLAMTGGNILRNTSCTFDVTLLVPAGAADGDYNNITSNAAGNNNVLDATMNGTVTTFDPATDALTVFSDYLSITKSFTDDPVVRGDTVTLDFTVTNLHTTLPATALAFTDVLDTNLTGLTYSSTVSDDCGGTLAGTTTLTYSGGTVAANSSCTLSVKLSVPSNASQGSYANTTNAVTATINAVNVTGNAATDSLEISAVTTPPTFGKAFSPNPANANAASTLTFTINNAASSIPATSLAFTDTLPTNLVVAGTPNASATCTGGTITAVAAATSITYTGGSVATGSSCTVSVDVTSSAAGSYANTSGTLTSSAGTSSTAASTLRVNPQPPFSKSFSPTIILRDGTSTLTFTVDNTGSTVNATSLAFTDTFPTNLVVAATPNASTTCTGGTLGAVAGATSFSYTGGTASLGGSCTVRVDVTSSTAGTYANTSGNLTSSLGTSGTAAATLTVDPSPPFTKSFSPTVILLDGTSTLTFTINNSGSTVNATGLGFIDTFPSGLVVAGTPNTSATCTGGTVTAVAGAGSMTYAGGTVPAGGSCTISVDVTSSTAGSYANTSGALTSSHGNSGTAASTLTVDPSPTFSKSFSPTIVLRDGTSTLTFTVNNASSTVNATSLGFTDTFPSGLVVAATPNASTTCTGGTLTAIAAAGSITYTGGTAPLGASCTITVDVTSSTAGSYANTSGALTSSHGDSGTAAATLTVDPSPSFSKSFSPNPIAKTGTSTLTFTIDNSGSTVNATSLDFTDTFPSGLVVAGTPNASTTCTGGTLTAAAGAGSTTYTGGTITAGGTCTVTVDVTSSTAGSYVNTTGSLTSSHGDSGTANDTLTVNELQAFSKSFSPNPVAIDGTSTLTFTIDNSGSSADAASLDFTDSFPSGLVVAGTPNASTTCTGGTLTATAAAGSVTYTGGTVTTGASCTIAVDVTSSTSGSYANTTGDLTSSLGNAGTATDTLTVDPVQTFSKSFSPTPIAIDATSTLTFTIDNSGSTAAATSLDFTDTFPTDLVIAGTPNASTTCTGGTLTATAGANAITYTGGTASLGAICTITVDVTSNTAGSYANTSGALTSSLGNSGTASATLVVDPIPTFSKSFSPTTILPDDVSTLTLTINNSGSTAAATSLDFTDNFPSGLVVAATPNESTTCTGGTLTATAGASAITYTGGTASLGTSCTIMVDVTSSTGGSYANTTGDLTSSLGNSGTAGATLVVNPPPTFSKSFSPNPVLRGAVSTLTVTINNSSGTVAATSLDFTDNFPSGLVVAATPNESTTCTGGTLTATAGANAISYTGGTVTTGSSCTVAVDVTSSRGGANVNITGALTSSLGNSGTAGDTLTVNPPPTFSKSFDTPNTTTSTVANGVTTTVTNTALRFSINNLNSSVSATNLGFTDNLPTGVTLAATPNASTTCTGGTLTAAAGASSITYAGGTVAARSSCTAKVNVISSTAGTYTNTTGDLTSSLGNSGKASAVFDNNPPAAPRVAGATPTTDVTPTWFWSSGGGGMGIFRYKVDNSDLTTGATLISAAAGTNVWVAGASYTPITALSEGLHTLYAQEKDGVGNWSLSGLFAITIDTTLQPPPNVGSGSNTSRSDCFTWRWSSAGGNGTFRYKLDDPDLTTGATVTTETSYTACGLSPGEHVLYIQEQYTTGFGKVLAAGTTWSAAVAVTATLSVPSLSELGMICFAIMLLLSGILILRRTLRYGD